MRLATTLLTTLLSVPLLADTVYTIPQGYTKITVAGADSSGGTVEPKLTAISVSLLNDIAHAGSATFGSFTPDSDPAAFTDANGNQLSSLGLTLTGTTTWTSDQWTSEPHLLYISVADDVDNADGIEPAQEAFLILDNTTSGGLTIACDSDISTRFPSSPSLTIRKANTIGTILANPSVAFDANDRVNFWNGTAWQSVRFLGGAWRDSVTFADATAMVVFPEEGLFIERAVATDTTLTLFGEVPAAPQIANLTNSGFLATRHPIPTALPDLNISNANWNDTNGDRVYLWNQTGKVWTAYRFLGGAWRNAVTFSDASALMISGDSAVFVSRGVATTPDNGTITPTLPYNPFEPSQ